MTRTAPALKGRAKSVRERFEAWHKRQYGEKPQLKFHGLGYAGLAQIEWVAWQAAFRAGRRSKGRG